METVKIRKEIQEVLKEEGYQGNDLKVKVEEMFNQLFMRQDKARARAIELKKINQARSSEETIRLFKQYIYELHKVENERKEAASNELKLIKENVPQYVEELSLEEEEAEMKAMNRKVQKTKEISISE